MKYIVALFALVLFIGPGCRAEDHNAAIAPAMESVIVKKADGTEHTFMAELADTLQSRTIGLMFRKSMPEDSGMLFVFDKEEPRSFWMKNTLIPLDMVFIRRDGVIDSIQANAIPYDERPVSSAGPAICVLEINGGRAAALGIKKGDVIINKSCVNTLAESLSIH